MNNKIRILIVEPNKEPRQTKVEHTLQNLQNVVDGLIEFVELEHNVDLVCNEEGKLRSLELNRAITNDIIAGTFFIAGQHKGETISLSRKQIRKYKKRFRLENDRNIIEFVKGTVGDSERLLYYNMVGIGKEIKFRV